MSKHFIIVIALLLSTTQVSKGQVQHGPKATEELFDELKELDSVLFHAAFVTCDHTVLEKMVAEDLEFFHDKDGLSSTSGKQFIDDMKGVCNGRKTGENLVVRRELVKGTLQVYPLNNYGAIQIGEHRFYIVNDDGSERLAEVAKFTHVWKEVEGKWQITRVLSYDHQPPEGD